MSRRITNVIEEKREELNLNFSEIFVGFVEIYYR
jgi:hypothetical protein